MIDVRNLRKQFGSFAAVEDISFTTRRGEIFGLLGPKGAGKSTTIGCIFGLIAPSGGSIAVDGHDTVRDGRASRAARAALGIVPQELASTISSWPLLEMDRRRAASGLVEVGLCFRPLQRTRRGSEAGCALARTALKDRHQLVSC